MAARMYCESLNVSRAVEPGIADTSGSLSRTRRVEVTVLDQD